jgi:hypothetical protein
MYPIKNKAILIFIFVLSVTSLVYIALSEKPVAGRSQEPKSPSPYPSEEMTFRNDQSGITLSGTLTLPAKTGSFPVVVLITGSGPQDRNEEVF